MDILSLVEEGKYDQLVEKIEEGKENEEGEAKKLDLNRRSKAGYSPLDMAALLGRKPLLELLLDNGADVNSSNKSGYTAVHHSAIWGRLDCLQVLLEKGASVAAKTRHQEDARSVAQRYGHLDCVHLIDCHEACVRLQEQVKETRAIVTDGDKLSGKWNKDDRSKVTALCNETTDWLLHNLPGSSTLSKVLEQKTNFEERLQPYLTKLRAQKGSANTARPT